MRHHFRQLALCVFAGLVAFSLVTTSLFPGADTARHQPETRAGSAGIGAFSFPYTYSVPAVPSSQGALGNTGPTIPISDIGINSGNPGYVGKIGNPWTGVPYPRLPAALEIHVLNGTAQSASNSVHARIKLVNITTGSAEYAYTGASGYANFSIFEGSYILEVASASSAFVNYTFEYTFNRQSESLTVYLMPSSYTRVSVGGQNSGTLWVRQRVNWGNNVLMPQLEVELLNASSSDAVIGTAYTASNGSAEFTGLSSSFRYELRSIGYSNPLTDTYYGMTNATSSAFSIAGAETVYTASGMFGISRSTALLTNVTVPRGAGMWNISSPATIDGGITYISSKIDFQSPVPLKIENATVYFNESYNLTGNPSSISFLNSRIIFLGENSYVLQSSTSGNTASANNSVFIGMNMKGYSGVTLHFANASDSVFLGIYSNGGSFISGNFLNDLITNSSGFDLTGREQTFSNLTHVTIVNTIFLGGASNYGTINMKDTAIFNSSTNISAERFDLNNSLLNETIPYEHLPNYGSVFGYISVQYFDANHSVFTISPPSNVSFQNFVTNITPNRPNGAYPSSPYVVFSFPGTPGVNNFVNFTASNLTRAFPPVNMNIQFGNYFTIANLYNDNINYNYSYSQVNQIMESYTSTPFLGGRISLTFDSVMNINNSIINGGLGQRIVPYLKNGIPDYITHDLFPFTYDIQSYSFFRFFPSGSGGTYFVENNSFQYIYWNLTWWNIGQDGAGFTDIWMETLAGASFATGAVPEIYIEHNTFWSPAFGTGGNGISGNVEFAKSGIKGYLSNNLFENSPRYVLGIPDNYSYYFFVPHMDDILATAANVTISDNTFLNLTNLTVPIGTDQAYQNGGSGGNLTLEGNQFYYYPAIGGINFINASWAWGPGGYYGAKVNFPGGYGYDGSNISYEIPMGYYSSLRLVNSMNGDYIFNTSVGQNATSPYVTNPNYQIRVPQQWSWAIEPDFIWNGTAYVAQYNGMGGPQPGLRWDGYLYSWSFEPNMTYIAANSTRAPAIPLKWSIQNPELQDMTVSLYSHNLTSGINTFIESRESTASVINLTYKYAPSIDGLKCIFFLNTSVNQSTGGQSYLLSFEEEGLPPGTQWGIKIGNISRQSTSNDIQFSLTNGSYNYSVYQLQGWSARNGSGTVTIHGGNSTVFVSFSQITYSVDFTENSFTGKKWSVEVGTHSANSTSDSISISLPNGTYAYNITPPKGFALIGTDRNITVSGSGVMVFLNFTETSISPQKSSNGQKIFMLDPAVAALIAVTVILAAAAVFLIFILPARRKRN